MLSCVGTALKVAFDTHAVAAPPVAVSPWVGTAHMAAHSNGGSSSWHQQTTCMAVIPQIGAGFLCSCCSLDGGGLLTTCKEPSLHLSPPFLWAQCCFKIFDNSYLNGCEVILTLKLSCQKLRDLGYRDPKFQNHLPVQSTFDSFSLL